LRGEIRDLQSRLGITTIMVTHDQEEALTMSDRIVVMNKGRIEQVGTPDDIYNRPATPFVADFVGRMNFLHGRLLDERQVDVHGALLNIAEPISFASGTELTVCIRPEDVMVRQLGEVSANVIEVQVGVMEFIGHHFTTSLHATGTNLGFSASFSMNDVRDLGIASGMSMRVSLPPDRLRVFAQPPH
jgi:iron(III) transport system ATP-binding protein